MSFSTLKMSELDEFIRERLTMTALEIFGGVEKKLIEYLEIISRAKEESARLQRLLDIVKHSTLKILQPTDVQHLSLPEPTQIKEEQELWTSQEEVQLQRFKSETTHSILTQESGFSNSTMSKLYMMRGIVSERLTTAGTGIVRAFESTFAEYQEEISRSEEERKRLQRLLDVVTQPVIKLHRTEVQHLFLSEPPQIKEEQELWTNQEEEQLQGLQSETTDSIFTSSSVKNNSDQEGSSECSHLVQAVKVEDIEGDSLPTNTTEEQIKAEPHVQDYAAPEPDSDSQSLSVVAPDCPAAQRLEEQGGVVPLVETVKSNTKTKNMALPMEGVPQGKKKPHQCLECKNTYSWKSHLLIHMRTHTREKPFQCEECNKSFRWQSNLIIHMRTHTGEKPFHCEECNKSFRWQPNLIIHMRTHTGEKPFQCNECHKTFICKSNFIYHMRIHTGEKPYHCQDCDRMYSRKAGLVEHMRTHTGEKPFQCQECNMTFKWHKSWIRHMRRHADIESFQY